MADKFIYDITFVRPLPSAPLKKGEPDGSVDFHRLMRNSKECHEKLMAFLKTEGVTADCTLVANESKTTIECTAAVASRIKTLPFVASAELSAFAAPTIKAGHADKVLYDIRVHLKDRSEWGHVGAGIYNKFKDLIIALAKSENEEIFIHLPKSDALGGSWLGVECAPAFLEKVKTLPRFESADVFEYYFESYRALQVTADGDETQLAKPLQVYAVMTSVKDSDINEAYQRIAKLDADIQKLAKKTGADVHMHRYVEPQDGFAPILVECSEKFLEMVKQLPLFEHAHDNEGGPKTVRRSDAPQIEPPEAMTPPKKGRSGPKR